MTLLAHYVHGAEDGFKFLLTKNPVRSFSGPWCQIHGISLFFKRLNGSRGLADSWPGIELLLLD